MTQATSFGQWLKQRRKALDLTQAELAKRVGCAVITIQKIEADERRPSRQMAELLAENLDIALGYFPAFVKFARLGTWYSVHHQAAERATWRLSPRHFTNLPMQPTPLIGRDQDVSAVRMRLLDEESRLLTLVGPPGIGKTRLAMRVASELLETFSDGVFFIALSHVIRPDLVATTIAQTLGVNRIGEQSYYARLREYLRDKHILLVLDNFEQMVSAAPQIAELLAECFWLSILVTSRAPLSIRGERQYPVSSLAVPPEMGADLDPSAIMAYSAIALFVERARSINPNFTLTADNARAVAAICTRLDGLPLAIELVARLTSILPPQTLLEHLSGRVMLHTEGMRDVSDRHHTLSNAIEWSYALLRPDEKLLFARLSVFVDGCALEAVETMMSDYPSLVPTDILVSLVRNRLVMQSDRSGEARFTLLETIRAYALERLAEQGEAQQIRQKHAEYCLTLAEKADPHLRTAAQQVWLDRLEVERGNLRAALSWFIDQVGDAELGLRLAGALIWFWIIRCHLSEGREWLSRALHTGSDARAILRARALFGAGSMAWLQGEIAVARTLVEESIAIYRKCGSAQQWNLTWALTGLAMVAAYQADYESTRAAAEEAMALARQLGDTWIIALALCTLGENCMMRHDYSAAYLCFEESLTLFRKIGDRFGAGISLLDWGYMDSIQDHYDDACARLEESVVMFSRVGERWMRAIALNILGQVAQQQGKYQQAAMLYDDSLDLLRKMGLEARIADVLHNLAQLAQSQGHPRLAERLYTESLALYSKQGNERGIDNCRSGLAALSSGREQRERRA